MKIIGASTGFLLAATVLAQDYTVIRFEASDYRNFPQDEMTQLLGDNSLILPSFQCNGKDELDPLKAPLRINPLRNSLRIRIPKTDTIYTYLLGKIFDESGAEVIRIEDPFVIKVFEALKRFESIEVARELLRHLEESRFPLIITLGGNSFRPDVPKGSGIAMAQAIAFFDYGRMSPGLPFSDIGSGGRILWNPNMVIDSIEADGVRRKIDPDVALAHEMYHAFDSIRGLLDMGMISGKDYPFEPIVEYRGVYFENLIRESLGVLYRKYYGNPQREDAPDLLNDQGEPIFIPSPCLKAP